MKRLVALAALAVAAPLSGQDVQQQARTIAFPNFTVDQNWTRASILVNSAQLGGFAYAKSRGASAADYGRWIGQTYSAGWGAANSGSAIRYARGIQNNVRALQGGKVEVLSVMDTSITMRISRWYASYFGPTKQIYGVTLAEYDTVFSAFNAEVGRYLGLRYEDHVDGDWLTVTISGRGREAVMDFPRSTFAIELTAQDPGVNPNLVGPSEITFGRDGHYTITHGGKPYLVADYSLSLDEIVFSNAPGDCGPGRYRWTVSSTTGNLTFGRLLDDCNTQRAAFLTRRAFTKK